MLSFVFRVLVVYAYHETPVSRENIMYFLSRGLVDPGDGDHVFVINGPHTLPPLDRPNIRVIERDNSCYDFGAWRIGIEIADIDAYTHFVLMNGSVRGPFLPLYEPRPWWRVLVRMLGGTWNVGLVGTSLNCWVSLRETHLQSMLLVTHRAGIELLLSKNLLRCMPSHSVAVYEGEIPTSQAFLTQNYSLRTTLLAFQHTLPAPGLVTPDAALGRGDDGARLFHICRRLLDHNHHSGDLYYPAEYYGTDIHPLETIFLKTGRRVSERHLDAYTRWAATNEL